MSITLSKPVICLFGTPSPTRSSELDEAQAYKNRQFATRIQGVGGAGSMRAEDLELKLDYLRERHGTRVATFATATPISNSLAEMYVMQSYLQPEALERSGVAHFDAWAATFGRTVTALELAPDGASYRLTSRFARFRNVPELLSMFASVADVRGADALALVRPALAGGRAETVVVAPSDGLASYVAGLAERAERVRSRAVRPEEDNMLKISGDGRKAALDLRLVGEVADGTTKVAAAAERIAQVFHDSREFLYTEATGEISDRHGGFQMVFCDLGTPGGRGTFNAYDELRDHLVRRGVPEGEIRFVHEAGDDRAKAELFAACRAGTVAVLVGSTEKMGVGTNVQTRLVALHHLDCPWRPADIEQREGRALRQGNQNAEVAIVRYVTEGSFDVFMWLVNRTRGSTTLPAPGAIMVTKQCWQGRRSSWTSGRTIPGAMPLPCGMWRRSRHGLSARSSRPPTTRWSSRSRTPTTSALSARRTPT